MLSISSLGHPSSDPCSGVSAAIGAPASHRPRDGMPYTERLAGRAPVCRVAHALGRSALRRGGGTAAVERWGLYGGWTGVVALITGGRGAALASAFVRFSLPVKIDAGLPALGGLSALFGAIESGIAFKRFHDSRQRRRRLERKVASRADLAAAPTEQGRRSAYLSHRSREIRLYQTLCNHKRATLAMIRDGVVQLPGTVTSALATVGHVVSKLAAAMPWFGVVGNVFAIGMSVAHIASGIQQYRMARRELARLRQCLENLPGTAPAIAAGNGADANANATKAIAHYHGMTVELARISLEAAMDAARTESRQALIRTGYGVLSLLLNMTALALAAAVLAGAIAATGGMAVGLAGGVLSAAWLLYANRRLKPAGGGEPPLVLGRALQVALGSDGAGLPDDAAMARGRKPSAMLGPPHRYLGVALLLKHLRGDGGPDGDELRRQARAMMAALGADDALIDAWSGAVTERDCRKSLKMMQAFLEGKAVGRPGDRVP